jgi:hypothetical protein
MKRLFKIIRSSLPDFISKLNTGNIIIVVFLIIILFYLGFSLVAPIRKLNQLNGAGTDPQQEIPAAYSRLYEHPEFFSMNKNKAFRESRLIMSESDSIGLAVNLPDSTISVEIKGIILHAAKIESYKVGRLFRALENQTYLNLFSSPLRIELHNATIAKEPVIIKKAPKDTIEAAKALVLPDTMQKKPAFIVFTLNNGFRLFIEQEKTGSFKAAKKRILFRAGNQLKQAGENFLYMLRFQIPPYNPVIRIHIARDDAVAIYRALPENALVTIKI